jgi:hypothetical protein
LEIVDLKEKAEMIRQGNLVERKGKNESRYS